jgi:lipopolysaccharide biosynthesis glycosyltransferase
MPQRFIIVSAINDYYLPLLIDLLRSLRECKTQCSFDIGLFDVGLSEQNRQLVSAFGVTIRTPGIDINYPDRVRWEQARPYFRAMTSRPFIPSYFPGYDAYMWIDADAWVQTPEALDVMLTAAAQDDRLYIASELDFDYSATLRGGLLWKEWFGSYQNCFFAEEAAPMFLRPMLNVGVFAMSPVAPHWQHWRQTLSKALGNIPEMTQQHFVIEQLCLNMTVYKNNLDVRVMPAEYNWMTVLGLPCWDEDQKLYVRPTPPHRPISIMHLAAQIKNATQTIHTVQGKVLQCPLTYAIFLKEQTILLP